MGSKSRSAAILATFAWSGLAQTQGPPTVMQIIRETVKEGKAAAHERTEAEYVQAFRNAKSESYYLAAASMSGTNEAWFFIGKPSFEAVEQARKKESQEPLKSALDLADAHDGALREGTRTLWAVYRPDMSYRAEKMSVGKMRYFSTAIYRVRLGHEADMMAGAKSILAAYEKASIDAVLLCYQVVAGAPAGTYLFFGPMETLKTMDGMQARQAALREAMGRESLEKLMRGTGDVFLSMETQLFAVSPTMSYVGPETVEADPAFWKPKAAAKPKPAP